MIILYILLGLVAAVLIAALARPNTFRVQRSAVIQAPPDRIYPLIADFHSWPLWSPWEKMDPAMQHTYSGSASGTGAQYAWSGNKKVGEGRMTILDTQAPNRISIDLEFMKPWKARNTTTFTMLPKGSGTEVTWAMEGPANFMSKLFGLLFSMEKMVGRDFERGLASLKEVSSK